MNKQVSTELVKARETIANNLRKILSEKYDENPKNIFLHPTDLTRISWENSILSFLESENPDSFNKIINDACKGTGYNIELYNPVEGLIFKE